MTRKPLCGIDGVLGSLISTPPPKIERNHEAVQQPGKNCRADVQGARRGRPLGRHGNPRSKKEKVTLRISSELAAQYRDWSWEARCSLSALVEKALIEYPRHRRR